MRAGVLALALGLFGLRCFAALPRLWVLLVLPPLGLLLLPTRGYPLAFFLVGFSWACVSAQLALDDRLAPELDDRILWLEGVGGGLPELREGVGGFQLGHPQARRAKLPSLIRVSWVAGPPVLAGERWRLAVQLRSPYGSVNPQVFDYQAWLLAQRIGALGTVKAGERVQAATGIADWRDQLRRRLLAVDAFGRQGALAALVL